MQAPIGIFGGTFDPVHLGHLHAARQVQEALSLQKLIFVPCSIPALDKRPHASAEQRLQMVLLAIGDIPAFTVDRCELDRDGPSYAYDTLQYFRELYADAPLCFVVGLDAFLNLQQWHRWQELFDLAHFVVMLRPGYKLPPASEMPGWVEQRQVDDIEILKSTTHGCIYICNIDPLDISATAIRTAITGNEDLDSMLPGPVQQYILGNNLYQ